jgi:drug/metabolite transporter (DMT)-like permease
MIFVQKAIKREHPSIVSIVQSSDILFALILQNVFSSSKSNLLAIIGSILVLTSIFIVGGQKLWLDRKNRTCIPTSIQENELKVEIKNNE